MSETSSEIGTVGDLRMAVSVAREANANCDLDTMVVIDLPDGTTWTVASVTYQEDLAGALVITAGRLLPGAGSATWTPPAPGGKS
jgi:hypothetical protein